MNKKRFLSLFLLTTLVTSSLVGCGPKKDNNAGKTPDAEKPVVDAENAVSSEEYFPLNEEVNITIAGVRGDGHAPFADTESLKELEGQTNIKVSWLDWPQSQQKEKRNLAFASGDLPDAFYGAWSLDSPDVVKYGSEGLLLPLNDYLNETYMPNFTRILENEPELLSALSTPTGEVYVLPTMNRNALPQTSDTMVINTEWLKKVGKEQPKTTDELFDVLMAFKDAGDLNGNGKSDEIPMTFMYGDGNTGLFSFMGFTGLVMNNKNSRMAMKDNTPVFMAATDEYKEYLHFMHKLYKNGLLDREAFTMDTPSYNAKTQTPTPTAGIISAWTAQAINNPIEGNDLTQEGVYTYLAPVKNSDRDVEPVWVQRGNPLNGNLSFAINADTKHPEEIVRWIDLAFAKETSVQNYLGKFGVHLNKEGDDKYSKIKNAEGKDFSQEEMSSLVPSKYAVAYILDGDFTLTDTIESPQNKNAADAIYGPYLQKNYVKDTAMSTIEEGEMVSYITPDLFSHVDQSAAKFITEGGIDEGWDAYLGQLKNLRVDDYVAIRTALHDRATK